MPIFLFRLSRLLATRLKGWRLALAIGAFVFSTSWLAMWAVEPAGSDIARPANYWWYFLVTAATVGYGDFFPASAAGHLVGAYVIVGGIVAVTILFTELASYIQTGRGKRMKGLVQLEIEGHIVILGYTPGRTERIVAELCVEDDLDVVLCAWDDQIAAHPMPERERVRFVRGDLTHVDVMARACVAEAATVVIDGRDDNETLAIAVAVDHADEDVHMVAALRDMGRCEHLRYVNPTVQCVQWHMPNLLTEEAQDPGITEVYQELMTSGGHGNTYSVRLPDGLADQSFGECQTLFGQRFGATVIAVRGGGGLVVSPSWDAPLEAGTTLYYLAAQRVDHTELAVRRRASTAHR